LKLAIREANVWLLKSFDRSMTESIVVKLGDLSMDFNDIAVLDKDRDIDLTVNLADVRPSPFWIAPRCLLSDLA
jgi:hypothetical protein